MTKQKKSIGKKGERSMKYRPVAAILAALAAMAAAGIAAAAVIKSRK